MALYDPNKRRRVGPPDYSAFAAASNKRAQALNGIAAPPATRAPALYRAGAAVGATNQAAHNAAGAVTGATDAYVDQSVGNAKLGASNFMRGVSGQPALTTLPAAAVPPPVAPNVAASSVAAPARPTPVLVDPSQAPSAMMADMSKAGVTPPQAAGTIPVAPVLQSPAAAPGVDTGVTLADGRKLNYGAMVNGVPTFSDGSGAPPGGAPSIPRTMSDANIAALGDRLNVVPASALTNPIGPTAPTLTPPGGAKFGISPQQNSDARLAQVMSGDWRTPLGIAAGNLKRSAGAASTVLQRKSALEGLGALQQSAARDAGLNTQGAAELQRQALLNQGQQAAENTRGQFGLADTRTRNAGQLADTRLRSAGQLENTDLAGQYNVAGARGDTLAPKDLIASAQKLVPGILGLDPLTGMVHDASAPGGARVPTGQEQQGALQQAMQNIRAALHPGAAPPQQTSTKTARPSPGEVRGGMRFKGGDPNVEGNWEKAQ